MLVTKALMACRLMEWLVLIVRCDRSDEGGRMVGITASGLSRGDLRVGRLGAIGSSSAGGLFARVVRE